MKRGFYVHFARDNIRKNRRLFLPFICTLAFMSAVFFLLNGLAYQPLWQNSFAGGSVVAMLQFGTVVMGLFSLIFLFYTHSMVIKQRKREFGLYSVLGMGKRHIVRILLTETLLTGLFGLVLGLLVGALFSYAGELLLLNLLRLPATAQFVFPWPSVLFTLVTFCAILLLIFANDARSVALTNTIDLLNSASEGEREPKAKVLLALLGAALLAGGYYLAVTITDPVEAMALFFVAVILVMLGTYLLFTAGSIVLLKALRRNRRYYYRTNHFISVSGMLYRMKQNAVSLANVCILSTMVLVTISSTLSLYVGVDNIVSERYPREFNSGVYLYDLPYDPACTQALANAVDSTLAERGMAAVNELPVRYLSFSVSIDGKTAATDYFSFEVPATLCVVPQEDYNRLSAQPLALQPGQAALYDPQDLFDAGEIELTFGSEGSENFNYREVTYTLTDEVETFEADGVLRDLSPYLVTVIVPGMDDLEAIRQAYREAYGGYAQLSCYLGFDLSKDLGGDILDTKTVDELRAAFSTALYRETSKIFGEDLSGVSTSLSSRELDYSDMISLYSGLFFLGILLGSVFMVSAALIIYYKQLSEGLSDRRRFEIMKKVGLTEGEIKKSIHSQVLTVFFLPLVAAGIHSAFALPMLDRAMTAMTGSNDIPFALCMGLCFLVFAVLYVAVYGLTSKVYYRIVDGPQKSPVIQK